MSLSEWFVLEFNSQFPKFEFDYEFRILAIWGNAFGYECNFASGNTVTLEPQNFIGPERVAISIVGTSLAYDLTRLWTDATRVSSFSSQTE